MELKEAQTKQIKQNKNNTNELIKEQQSHSKTKSQLDDYQITLEKMISLKIFLLNMKMLKIKKFYRNSKIYDGSYEYIRSR